MRASERQEVQHREFLWRRGDEGTRETATDYDEDPLLSPLRHLSSLKCVDTTEWPGHRAGPAARCVGSQIEPVLRRSQAK